MSDSSLSRLLSEELARRREAHQFRQLRPVQRLSTTEVSLDGRRCVNFGSNDYLGLSHHPRMIAAAKAAMEQGVGAGASPLISGYSDLHAQAQEKIARWKGTEQAVLLPSGYQAAHAAIGALAGVGRFHKPGVRFLVDKLAHASLLDAIAASGAAVRIFPHNHLAKLRRLLASADPRQLQVVVTESIFSMDGDAADLPGLSDLRDRHQFALLLDEAHGSGVYGPAGAGYAAHCGLSHRVDVSIVTLSKALGAAGGAICGPEAVCQAIVNWGRAFIYSTAVPPAVCASAMTAIDILHDEPERQTRLNELVKYVRRKLGEAMLTVVPGDSPIIPVVLGSEKAALAASEALRQQGIFVPAVRPPTVPPGSSRLRITLNSEHGLEQVDRLVNGVSALAEVRAENEDRSK